VHFVGPTRTIGFAIESLQTTPTAVVAVKTAGDGAGGGGSCATGGGGLASCPSLLPDGIAAPRATRPNTTAQTASMMTAIRPGRPRLLHQAENRSIRAIRPEPRLRDRPSLTYCLRGRRTGRRAPLPSRAKAEAAE
jgi:hypothetical protein